MRIAILISGRGSNMVRLADEIATQNLPTQICLVASNKPCAGIDLAMQRDLPVVTVDRALFSNKADQEQALGDAIEAAGTDLIFLAGYMAILSAEFVDRFAGKIINIHPSLLPAFKGLDTHERALTAGVDTHGVSVHLVTAALDDGPLLAQASITVNHSENETELAARVLTLEHALYPFILQALCDNRLMIRDGQPVWDAGPAFLTMTRPAIRDVLQPAIIWPG